MDTFNETFYNVTNDLLGVHSELMESYAGVLNSLKAQYGVKFPEVHMQRMWRFLKSIKEVDAAIRSFIALGNPSIDLTKFHEGLEGLVGVYKEMALDDTLKPDESVPRFLSAIKRLSRLMLDNSAQTFSGSNTSTYIFAVSELGPITEMNEGVLFSKQDRGGDSASDFNADQLAERIAKRANGL